MEIEGTTPREENDEDDGCPCGSPRAQCPQYGDVGRNQELPVFWRTVSRLET